MTTTLYNNNNYILYYNLPNNLRLEKYKNQDTITETHQVFWNG